MRSPTQRLQLGSTERHLVSAQRSCIRAFLATCTDEEKAGIRIIYQVNGEDMCGILKQEPGTEQLPELPEAPEDRHCESSDEEKEIREGWSDEGSSSAEED
jgi:hypothetical protein